MRGGVRRARRRARRPRRRCCCPTARSSSSPSSAPGSSAPSSRRSIRSTPSTSSRGRCASTASRPIVTLTRFYAAREARPAADRRCARVIATNIKEYFPPLLRVLFTLLRETARRRSRRAGGRAITTSRTCCARIAAQAPRRAPLTPDDPAVLLMSGGTTGTPKGVLGTHGAYVHDRPADAGVDAIGARAARRRHLPAAAALSRLRQRRRPGAGVRHRQPDRARARIRATSPICSRRSGASSRRSSTACRRSTSRCSIIRTCSSGKVDFKSIKICFSGAAALLADTKQRFEALTGGRIVEGYSLTEAMMALCVNPVKGPNKIGSVGMPLPDVHVRIFDGDEGTRVMPAERGRRDRVLRAAADDGLLEPARRDRAACCAITSTTASRGAGCTPATSATSTRTATSSSSIGRRI